MVEIAKEAESRGKPATTLIGLRPCEISQIVDEVVESP